MPDLNDDVVSGFASALQDAAYQAGIALIDESPSLKQAAEATLTDYRKAFPNASKDDVISHLGYFATFLIDLLRIGGDGFLFLDAEQAVSRIASTFGAAGMLAYGIKEETNGAN